MHVGMEKLRFIAGISVVLYFLLASCGSIFSDDKDEQPFVFQIHGDLLTVKVKDVPLRKVMKEFAKQMSVKISFFASEEELIMADFSRIPIEEGLKRLLGDFNYSFVYDRRNSKNDSPGIKKIIVLSRKDGVPYRRSASKEVTSSGEPSYEKTMKDLKSDDPLVREEAVDALGATKNENGVSVLAGILFNDSDDDVRMSAADALGMIGSEDAIDTLKEALNDNSVVVRMSAVESLGSVGNEDVVSSLSKALLDKDKEVRESVVESLGMIGGEMAIQALQSALSDEDKYVRESAAEILKEVASDQEYR